MRAKQIFSTFLFTGVAALALSRPARAAGLAAAQDNYEAFCVLCHGATGKGDGPSRAAVKARDFTDCATMSKISDDTMFNVIKNGGPAAGLSKAMQPWGSGFEDADIRDLVAYIRTLCKK